MMACITRLRSMGCWLKTECEAGLLGKQMNNLWEQQLRFSLEKFKGIYGNRFILLP